MSLSLWLYKDQVSSHCSCWPPAPPESSSGWGSKMRHCALGKTGRTDLQIGIFRRKNFEPNFLCLCTLREALKSLVKTSTVCDQQQYSTEVHASLHSPPKPKLHVCWPPLGFPGGSAGKESNCNAGDLGFIPGFGRSPGEGKNYPLQYWPEEFHGLYGPWGCRESDMTERLSLFCLTTDHQPPPPSWPLISSKWFLSSLREILSSGLQASVSFQRKLKLTFLTLCVIFPHLTVQVICLICSFLNIIYPFVHCNLTLNYYPTCITPPFPTITIILNLDIIKRE